jgi:uncharacterized protein (DUF697 family)
MTTVPNAKLFSALVQGLEWLYDKAVTGAPALDGAGDLAVSYRRQYSSHDDAVDALIKWQMAKAGTAGFVSSIGGVLTLPVALPANLASVTYIQLRMIAAIAHLRGHNLRDDQVRALALACLCGSSVVDVIKDLGVRFGAHVAQQAITRVSGESLKQLNTAIACRLVAITGSAAPINLTKLVPVLGGLISGGLDAAVTRTYGNTAKRLFLPVTVAA